MIRVFEEHGAALGQKFSFETLKGLLNLAGEGYMPEDAFKEVMGSEIRRHLYLKWPLVLWDSLRLRWLGGKA